MRYTLTCDGVPVGFVALAGALRDQAVPRGAVAAPIEAGPGEGARPAA